MQLFEGYTVDELHRVLGASRWIASLLLLLTVAAFAVNQWLVHRIATQQKQERDVGKTRLISAEEELRRLRSQTSAVTSTLDKLTSSRKLTVEQIAKLRSALASAEKGKVIVTYLTVEWDSEEYAKQLATVLKEIGYDVVLSDYIWVHLDHDGLFIVSSAKVPPTAAIKLQAAFAQIGVEVSMPPVGDIAKEVGAENGETILVVSNR
jgi:hypothetical protein